MPPDEFSMQQAILVGLCGIFLAAAGCEAGPRLIPVKGQVSLDGVPIEVGLVQFEAADGRSPSAKGGIIAKGEYSAEVPAGEMIVKITGSKVVGTYQPYEGVPGGPVKEKFEQFVPKQFNTETTLKVSVQANMEPLNFHLKSK
jgi:hypothetical protein